MKAAWRRENLDLVCALLAGLVIIIRAAHQSITIDEAGDYVLFVRHGAATVWAASSGNHLLYSLLELLSTTIFGLSAFTARLPAVLGAILYLSSSVALCRLLLPRLGPRLVFLVALIFNPMVLDYLIAARGYSLALGFLQCAIWLVATVLMRAGTAPVRSLSTRLGAASALLGLMVAANFSFAVAGAVFASLTLLTLDAVLRPSRRVICQLGLVVAVPGLLVLYLIAGWTITHWPSGQFVYGATMFGGMIRSLVDDSLYQPNASFLQPQLLTVVNAVRDAVPYVVGAGVLVAAVLRVRIRRESRLAGRTAVSVLLLASAAVTLVIHLLLRASTGLLLPMGRTGSFAVSFTVVGLAAAASGEVISRRAFWPARTEGVSASERESSGVGRGRSMHRQLPLITGVIALLALIEVLCLRLDYFQEWRFDAETAAAYRVLANAARRTGAEHPVANWRYVPSLSFYADQSGTPPFGQVLQNPHSYPRGYRLYVLYGPQDEGFIVRNHLRRLYDGPLSGIVVAAAP